MDRSRVLSLAVGAPAAVVGGALLIRPFASLTVLLLLIVVGLLVMAASRVAEAETPRGVLDLLPAAVYAVGALLVLGWPGSAVLAVVWIVAVSLVVDGLSGILRGVRVPGPGRAAVVVRGVACAVLGVLAVAWPSVASIAIAVTFGIRLLWAGLGLIWSGLRGPAATTRSPAAHPPRWRGGLSLVTAVATLVLALVLAGIGSLVSRSTPVPDDFYSSPADVPAEPGQLLRTADFDRKVPEGATARRILYTTTALGEPALASALLVLPEEAGDGPVPLVAWAHGTTGVAQGCAPSLLPEPFESGAMFTLPDVVERGWAVVATDYVGLGTEGPHAYLVGEPAGHAVLDSIRAARQVEGVDLADEAVVWGHSQGGHAALWTGILAPAHAPDAGVVGVAAMAPASNLPGLVENLDGVTGGSIFASYVIRGYSSAHDDIRVRDHVRGAAQVQVREMAERCLSGLGALLNVVESLTQDRSILSSDPASGALGARLAENVPSGPIEVPVLLAQGRADGLITPTAQREYVDRRCRSEGSGPVDYRVYDDRDHVSLVAADSPLVPELLDWTAARFAGDEAPDTCAAR